MKKTKNSKTEATEAMPAAAPVADMPAAATAPETMPAAEPAAGIPAITPRTPVVVCGTAATLPLLGRLWRQNAAPAEIRTVDVSEREFSEIIDELMAWDDIPDTFVLVPANCFPTHRVTLADLIAYRVRRTYEAGRADRPVILQQTGLPALIEAAAALRALESLGETYTEEEFFAAYNAVAHAGELPEEIGMGFGNAVSYALRRPKCAASVALAIRQKRFVSTNDEGFDAIRKHLELLLRDDG